MNESNVCEVLIVDDHPLMRRGIRQLLEMDNDFVVVGEASSGTEAISQAYHLSPDLILLDLNMKGLSGLDTLNALRREGISSRIIVLSVSDSRGDIFTLIDAGADGYLLKDSDPEVLLNDIRRGARGGEAFSEQVAEYLRTRGTDKRSNNPFATLTEHELYVLQEVARGLSNKQIAASLHISEETVKVHIRNLLRKLQVRSRVAATVLFLESRGV